MIYKIILLSLPGIRRVTENLSFFWLNDYYYIVKPEARPKRFKPEHGQNISLYSALTLLLKYLNTKYN